MAALADIPDPGPRARYSTRPLPAYRYVPGVRPHPLRDPAGHSYRGTASFTRHPPWRPDDWRSLDDWLHGVDLFNAHYFWEAHEAWEGPWAAVDRGSPPALLLQGLIQIAAALLKAHLGSLGGARVLSREGLAKLRQVATGAPEMMGLDIPEVIADFATWFAPVEEGVSPDLTRAPVLRLRL